MLIEREIVANWIWLIALESGALPEVSPLHLPDLAAQLRRQIGVRWDLEPTARAMLDRCGGDPQRAVQELPAYQRPPVERRMNGVVVSVTPDWTTTPPSPPAECPPETPCWFCAGIGRYQ